MKILIVEDNSIIVDGLTYFLTNEGYEVVVASTYKEALDKINSVLEIVILDISLPDGDGFELCKIIKQQSDMPVLFLTAKDEEDDIVKGLTLADDYLVKPFHNRELLMRINKIINQNNKNRILQIKELVIDLDKCEVKKDNKIIPLTALEFKIFNILLENRNRVVSLEYLLEFIYDETHNYVNDNTLRVYIKRIREKIEDEDFIKTVKGLGYRIDEDV